MYIIQQAELGYRMHEEKWPCSKDTLIENESFDMNLFLMMGYKAVKVVAQFCTMIKAFAVLPLDQKTLICRHFFVKFLQIDRTFVGVTLLGNDRKDKRMITIHGHVLNFYDMKMDVSMVTEMSHEQLKKILLLSETKYDQEFIQPFKLLNPDRFEVLYMIMRSMWEIEGFKGFSKETESIAAEMLEKLSDELCYYYKYEKRLENVADRIYKLHMLLIGLNRVAELRKQDSQMVQVFEIFKMDVYMAEFTIDR